MLHRPSRIALVVVVLSLPPAVAAATDEPSLFTQHPTTVYAQLGLGTPLGWGGVEIEQTLSSFLALSGGAGMGFAGPQVAFMPRLRLGNRDSVGTFGVGVSHGKYHLEQTCLFDCVSAMFDGTVTWANFEGGVEHRRDGGFTLRVFAGYGQIVAGELACSGDFCSSGQDVAHRLLYAGAAAGWSF